MMKIQKILLMLVAITLTLSAQFAYAASLQQAKSDGWIGEQNNGYIGFAKPGAPADVKQLVADVNGKRRTHFANIATKKRISIGDVEVVAGEKFIAKTASGQYVQDASGNWIKKK